jgi:polyhydroxybutyrate depolymerase
MRRSFLLVGLIAGCSSAETGAIDSMSEGTASTPATGTSDEGPTEPEKTSVTGTSDAPALSTGGDEVTGDPSEPTTMASGPQETGTDTGDDTTTGVMSGGCGMPAPFAGAMEQTLEIEGVERSYILVVPDGYDPAQAYPLVFAWHGRGGDASTSRLYFKVEEAAQGAAIFVYPNGLELPEMENQTGWDLDPANEDFKFFDAMLAQMSATLCVDEGRVFSTGHSFGGYMSNQLGCFRGDVLRAIGPVAGGGPFGGGCVGQVAAWLAHGTMDMVVPFTQGEGSRDHWAQANGCAAEAEAVDPAPCTTFTGCADGFPVTWCAHEIPDFLGHTWPTWAGPAIWKFFAQF